MAPDNRPEDESPLDRSLRAIRQLRARLETVEGAQRAPIAIVGMGCRVPGVEGDVCGPDGFWDLLATGGDAVKDRPPGRGARNDAPLRAGWLHNVDRFDARFFGVSPREVVRMDPQQRLTLEVAWEALEHAGLPPSSLAGTEAGVFVGVNSSDYFWLQLAARKADDTYTINGATHSSVPNRLSYQLDLKGPSLAVDSACSSSLVAVHLACRSLRSGECSVALAGGVNLVLSGDVTAVHQCGLPLLADGCSRTFDAGANGYARGEGCGIVVLKRLADAQADGDRIWAVIRGTAVNQDGRTHGVSAPNGTAQRALIRSALAEARVPAASIRFIEAHGTGTELGDPIEAEAMAAVYGEGRTTDQVAWLGAVKTNLGHLEAAAGSVGLIKAVLALDREMVPKNLHFTRINPHISIDESRFQIADRACPWPRTADAPRRAAVSSFGAGGTNAHLILEEAPEAPVGHSGDVDAAPDAPERPFILALSADRPQTLRAVGERWAEFLTAIDDTTVRDTCFTAAVRRDHFEHRATVVARSRESLHRRLHALARDEPDDGVIRQRVSWSGGATRGLVFAFAGMGAHAVDQGRHLLAIEPAFRRALTSVDAEIQEQAGWSVIEMLTDERRQASAGIDRTQPTLFALQIGLAALWRSWGVVPDAVVGHSLGEVAAARVAGALSLPDAARVVLARSRQLESVAGDGAMTLVGLSVEDAATLAAELAADRAETDRAPLAVAVDMGHQASVLSGSKTDVERAVEVLRKRNVFCRLLDVDIAFHSPRVEPLASALGVELAGLDPRRATIPFCSTVTGDFVDGAQLDADYWRRNLLQPVRFWPALRQLAATHHGVFVELGGHAVLTPAIRQDFEHLDAPVVAVASLRRGENSHTTMLRALGGLHGAGASVDWPAVVGDRRQVTVPTYPWHRQRYWFTDDGADATVVADVDGAPHSAAQADPILVPPSLADGGDADNGADGDRGSLARQLATTASHRRRDVLLGHVLDEAAAVLGLVGDEADLEPDQGFFQLGMDSRMAVELADRLARALDRPLPSTVTFEHPTSDALCDVLSETVLAVGPESKVPPSDARAEVPSLVAPHDGTNGDGPTPVEANTLGREEIDDHTGDDVAALLREHIAAIEAGRGM